MSDTLLYSLLLASITTSTILTLISMAMVGRKIADMEYQKASGINGSIRIQAVVNIRTHVLRVVVGLTFVIISALLLGNAPEPWRQWINRLLFVLLPFSYMTASFLDWLAERQQIRIKIDQDTVRRRVTAESAAKAEQQRTATLRSDLEDWRGIAAVAVENLRIAAESARTARGEESLPTVAPVIPEHQSPVTPEQKATAEKATARASLTASTLALGLPARDASVIPPSIPPAVLLAPLTGNPTDEPQDALGRSLGEMASAAGETLDAAEKTVVAAESAVEEINKERAERQE